MIRLHLRCWWTGPGLPAAGGLAALVVATSLLALWASIRTGIPILNITVTMLLPLALGGSLVTTILLPARPSRRRVVAVPAAPRGPAPRPVPFEGWGMGRGATCTPGRHFPAGRASRPPAARLPDIPAAAAGPIVAGGAA